jgi:hypothetical protein
MSDGVRGQAAAREDRLGSAYLERGRGYGWLLLSLSKSSTFAFSS